MAEDYTYEIGEILSGEIEYPPQWVRDYIYANQDANVTAWGGTDVSFTASSATESYGKGTYRLSANLVRESTSGDVDNPGTDRNFAMTNLFNNDYNKSYHQSVYYTGWQTGPTSLTNPNFSIDLTPTLTITSDSDIPVVTIEFPDALQITKYTLWGANENGTYAEHYLFGYDESTGVYDLLNHSTDTLNNTSATYNVNSAGKVYKKYAFTPSQPVYTQYITPELRFFGYVVRTTPASLTFTDDILTIENSIDANDIDPVSFVLPDGYEMSNLNVTNFSGTGTVSYTISTDGATDITGTFTAKDVNILDGNPLVPGADATYTLTLTADAAITYTIMGTKTVDYGVITYGTPDWSTLSKTTISPDVPIAGAQFGNAIAISGNYAIVGAVSTNKAYIFEKTGLGGWSQVSVLEHTLHTVANFGISVAIDGDYAIVGAYNTPSLGGNTWTDGSAHIFERDSSGVWSEVVMLQPSTKLAGTGTSPGYARFGASVAIDGDYVAIGANRNSFYRTDGATTFGSAHIYKRDDDGNWNSFDDVNAFNTDLSNRAGGNAIFGSSIVLQGDELFVGTGGTSNQGGATLYIFKMNSGGTGFEPAQSISPTGDDGFSNNSIAVSGDYMIVSAIYDDYYNNSFSNTGAMYTYARNSSGVWEQRQYLHLQDPVINDQFAFAVAMHGDKAIVTSRSKKGPENAYSGVAVVYERAGSNWTQIQYIEPTSYGDQFGFAVAMDGDTWLVGEIYEDSGGVVYSYGPNIPIILNPTPLTFTDDILTIQNSINASDTDPVNFMLPVGYEMSNLDVTNFSGTGTVSYTISTDGATDITGTFSAIGDNLLAGNPLVPGADATYTLTLTADAAITYTIVGTKTVDYGNILTQGVVIHYTFDVDGTNSGTLGNGYDLTIPTQFEIRSGGINGTNCMYANKTTDDNTITTIPTNFTLPTNFTISMWAKNDTWTIINQRLMEFYITELSSDVNFVFAFNTATVMNLYILGQSWTPEIPGEINCFDNEWHHYVITYTNSNSTNGPVVSLYIDSVLIGSNEYNLSNHGSGVNTISGLVVDKYSIGASHAGASVFNGYIDHFIIYDSVIDIEEIKVAFPLTFTDDILTIENSISQNDTDPVSFVLPAGYEMSNLNVTNFSGTGTVTYTISTDGATDITGTFTASGTNLLSGNPIFVIATDTTYNLTLTADASITYTIMGTRLYTMSSSEYPISQLITAGYTQQQLIDGNFWIADDTANRFFPIYDDGLLDVSGGNMIVRDNFIMGSGNIDLSNALITQSCTIDADITVNNKLFVTGDVSMGTVGLNVAGDITINGNLSVESYKNNSISPSAVKSDAGGSITESNITAIINNASYDKLQMNGDVSLNATVSTPGYSITLETVANTVPVLESNDSPTNAITLNTSNSSVLTTSLQSYQGEVPVIDGTGRLVCIINSNGTGYLSTNYGSGLSNIGSNFIGIGISDDASHLCKVQMDTGIHISTDEGSTWTNTYTDFTGITFTPHPGGERGPPSVNECSVSVSGNGQYMVVIPAKNTNVLFSNDFGATWSSKFSVGNNSKNNTNMSNSGQYICIHEATGTGKIWMSNDYGVTFLENSTTLSSNYCLHISMSSNGQYIALRSHWGSKDYGVTWGSYGGSLRWGNYSGDKRFEGQTHAIWGPNPNIQVLVNMWNPQLFISVDGGATYNIGSTQITTATGGNFTGTYRKITTLALSNDGKNLYITTKLGREVARINIDGIGYTPPVYQASSDKVTYFGASTKLKLTNGIQLSDNTIVNTTNISSGTYATNNVVFKPSHFDNMTVTGDFASNPPLSASDYRIKTNIQELDETHTIDKLRPVTYYQTQMKKNAIGFIAHELQEHYPELVEGEKDGDKMQSVNYTGILAILINEIKQLKKNIKDTRNTLSGQNSAS